MILLSGTSTLYAASLLRSLPDPGHESVLARSIVVYDRAGNVLAERNPRGEYHVVLKLSEMGKYGPAATLAAEDRDFYHHGPIDLLALARAALVDLAAGRPVEGGSTISQQLVKIQLLGPERSVSRKVQEAYLAYMLEHRYSKDQILEMYLNRVYYGHGAYGIGSAVKTYFGKDAETANLSPAQAAFLAGLLAAPAADDPATHFDRARERELYVLKGMKDTGSIDEAQYQKAVDEPIRSRLKFDTSYRASHAPHFVDYIVQRLESEYGSAAVQQGGFGVYTTLDSSLQALAEGAVRNGVAALGGYGVNNGDLLAARPGTGEVLAWVGSADYGNDAIGGQFDVVLSPRQTGSSFKPYVYEAALRDHRITWSTAVHDSPQNFSGYRPLDYDGSYMGTMCASRALLLSRNIPAVEVASKEGIDNVIRLAHAMGVKSQLRPELPTAIGGSEMTLFEHLQGYSVFANQGVKVPLYSITRIVDGNGRNVYQYKPPAQLERVLSPAEAYLMTDVLKDYQKQWALGWNRQMAGKTGTSGDKLGNQPDSWMLAYNPDVVVGSWVGNTGPNGQGKSITAWGELVGKTLLANFINGLPQGYSHWYTRPDGLQQASGGGYAFLSGTVPAQTSCSGGGGGGGEEGGGGGGKKK